MCESRDKTRPECYLSMKYMAVVYIEVPFVLGYCRGHFHLFSSKPLSYNLQNNFTTHL